MSYQQPMLYDEQCLRLRLQDKHFLLECLLEKELPRMEFARLAMHIRHDLDSSKKRLVFDALRVLDPIELLAFAGLKKWSAEWWSCVVRLGHPSPSINDRYIVMLGWNNNHGAANVIASIQDQLDKAKQLSSERIKTKEDQGYGGCFVVDKLEINSCVALPNLPGLARVEEEPVPSSLRTPAPAPVRKPEPRPHITAVPVSKTKTASVAAKPAKTDSVTNVAAKPYKGEPKTPSRSELSEEQRKKALQEKMKRRKSSSDW